MNLAFWARSAATAASWVFIGDFTSAADQPVDVRAIIGRIESNLAPKACQALKNFTSIRNDGTIATCEVRFLSKDVDHIHGVFLQPEGERGREILRVGDELWSWRPAEGRAVSSTDRDSFADGDFSNADILRIDWLKRYDPQLARETAKQWIIDLKARTGDAPYARMRIWVDRESHQPVQQHCYDSHGTLVKRCLYGSVQTFGSIERPAHLVMQNMITKRKSELRIVDMLFDQPIPDSRFLVENLGVSAGELTPRS